MTSSLAQLPGQCPDARHALVYKALPGFKKLWPSPTAAPPNLKRRRCLPHAEGLTATCINGALIFLSCASFAKLMYGFGAHLHCNGQELAAFTLHAAITGRAHNAINGVLCLNAYDKRACQPHPTDVTLAVSTTTPAREYGTVHASLEGQHPAKTHRRIVV